MISSEHSVTLTEFSNLNNESSSRRRNCFRCPRTKSTTHLASNSDRQCRRPVTLYDGDARLGEHPRLLLHLALHQLQMILVLRLRVNLLLRLLVLVILCLLHDFLVVLLLLLLPDHLQGVLFHDLPVLEELGLHFFLFLGGLAGELLLLGGALGRVGRAGVVADGLAILAELVVGWEVLHDLGDVGFLLLVVLVRFVQFCLVNVGENIVVFKVVANRQLAEPILVLLLVLCILFLDHLQARFLQFDVLLLLRLRLVVLFHFLPALVSRQLHLLLLALVNIFSIHSEVLSDLAGATLRHLLLVVFLVLVDVVLVRCIFAYVIEVLLLQLLVIQPFPLFLSDLLQLLLLNGLGLLQFQFLRFYLFILEFLQIFLYDTIPLIIINA